MFNQSSARLYFTDGLSMFRTYIHSKSSSNVHLGYTLQIFNQSSTKIYFTNVQSKFSSDIIYKCSTKVQPGYSLLIIITDCNYCIQGHLRMANWPAWSSRASKRPIWPGGDCGRNLPLNATG